MTPSWRLKLYRAEKHLRDLKAWLPNDTDREPHKVIERFNPDEDGGTWSYFLSLDFEAHERILPVIGEFLFNARSALDHLAAACVSATDRDNVQFPIFWEDPISIDEATGGHVNPKAWKSWKGRIRPFPPDLQSTIIDMQPFEQARKFSKPAVDHSLAILASLQDTDKHQQLVVAPTTLFKIAITIDGMTDWLVPGMHNGELICTSPTKLDIQIEGALQVAIGISLDASREFPIVFDELMNCIANDVLPPMESFLGI